MKNNAGGGSGNFSGSGMPPGTNPEMGGGAPNNAGNNPNQNSMAAQGGAQSA